jgi:hypothetical protein
MTTNQGMPAYEACREWALHPWLPRPPGVAHIVRGGIITWVRKSHPLPVPPLQTRSACPVPTPLLTVVAAMIEEVCQ